MTMRGLGIGVALAYYLWASREAPVWLATVLFFAAPVVVGLLVGRWWALLLPLLSIVALEVFGDGCMAEAAKDPSVECDIDWFWLLLMFYVPIYVGLTAIGLGTRRLVPSARCQGSP